MRPKFINMWQPENAECCEILNMETGQYVASHLLGKSFGEWNSKRVLQLNL
jgi:hypothetical protein